MDKFQRLMAILGPPRNRFSVLYHALFSYDTRSREANLDLKQYEFLDFMRIIHDGDDLKLWISLVETEGNSAWIGAMLGKLGTLRKCSRRMRNF